jgi:chromate transporter
MLRRLWELARLFLRLGAVSFGGPAAYIVSMEHEAVGRRGWLSRQQFLDLLAATYLIPGPNAVEMANHIGYQRAGLLGLIVAGAAFTLPAALISAGLAWGYQRYGALRQLEPLLHGIKPVVLGIMAAAIWRLGTAGWKSWRLAVIGVAVAAASLARCDEILALLVGSLGGAVFLRFWRHNSERPGSAACGLVAAAAAAGKPSTARAALGIAAAGAGAVPAVGATAVSLWTLALFFLKVGAVLYGSGYVLVAYLEGGLVHQYHWLSHEQLLDAVAVGQITPGPLLSTVTFVGYLTAGFPGAGVATVAILLPSFVLVAAVNPWIPRLRRSRWASLFLDAVVAASVGLAAAVLFRLGQPTLVDWPEWLLAIAAAAVMLRWQQVPALALVLAGAAAGWLLW